MTSTYLLYFTMMIGIPLILKSIIGSRRKASGIQYVFVILLLILLSVVIGGRYEVGTDFPNYIEYYKSFLLNISTFGDIFLWGNNLEPGYLLINWLGARLDLSVSLFFSLIAFISFILLFKATQDRVYLWPLVLFFFFGQMFGISMNIIRQSCAIFLFVYAVQFIGKDKFKLFLLITCCVLFHYSSVVFYLALLIDSTLFKFLDTKKLVIILFVSTWLLASYFLPLFMQVLPLDIFSDKYLSSLESVDLEMAVTSGLGILTAKLLDLLLIWNSDYVVEYYKDDKLKCIYRLFFVGIILTNVMGISIFLSRVFLGMVMLRILILSYTTYYFFRRKDYKFLLGVGVIALSLLQFTMGIRNGAGGMSPYQFMWQ